MAKDTARWIDLRIACERDESAFTESRLISTTLEHPPEYTDDPRKLSYNSAVSQTLDVRLIVTQGWKRSARSRPISRKSTNRTSHRTGPDCLGRRYGTSGSSCKYHLAVRPACWSSRPLSAALCQDQHPSHSTKTRSTAHMGAIEGRHHARAVVSGMVISLQSGGVSRADLGWSCLCRYLR